MVAKELLRIMIASLLLATEDRMPATGDKD
jgi:hypothetical protein